MLTGQKRSPSMFAGEGHRQTGIKSLTHPDSFVSFPSLFVSLNQEENNCSCLRAFYSEKLSTNLKKNGKKQGQHSVSVMKLILSFDF